MDSEEVKKEYEKAEELGRKLREKFEENKPRLKKAALIASSVLAGVIIQAIFSARSHSRRMERISSGRLGAMIDDLKDGVPMIIRLKDGYITLAEIPDEEKELLDPQN